MERGDPLPGVQGPRSQLQKGPVSALEAMALCPCCAQMPPGARTLPREHKVRGPGRQEAARPSAASAASLLLWPAAPLRDSL